jgi:cytochrome o ubiquinol oxidase subunit IV
MHDPSLKELQRSWPACYRGYLLGFLLCLLLSTASFSLVVFDFPSLSYLLVALALIQAAIQLKLFLHLGKEEKPRWESVVFCLMLIILLIIAIGTLWIMADLNARTMGHHD